MPLSIHTRDIKDSQDLWLTAEGGGKYLNPMTYTLGVLSVRCGFSRITEYNAAEVFWRVKVTEEYYGAVRPSAQGPVFFTEDDIRRHIGMRTNATSIPKARFYRKLRELKAKDEQEKSTA